MSFPVLSQIEPQAPLLVVPWWCPGGGAFPSILLSFSLATKLPPRTQISFLSNTCGTQTNKVGHGPYLILPCKCVHHKRTHMKHFNFHEEKVPSTAPHNKVQIQSSEKRPRAIQMLTRKGEPTVLGREQTMSFTTATTLICALRSGITAAVCTRLALQVILLNRFKFFSF